ncbi:hypothetical protein C2E25_10480 [Geothermobacter hydrogeniphilus]|uniref:Uncharacterized protein n=2 Tax=Geothermobacter hydrogeniphilus TaxID=1969733 RepID=A0A2K2H9F3_9BACT|nr:hypothetical protein C2E25_10480 [Geothermobacter hydrogeniphilus]
MEESTQLSLQCFFCFSTQFVLPEENYQPRQGELIQCDNCGRWNDYDSLIRVAQRKGQEWVEEQAQVLMNDFAKQLGKMFK